MSESYNSLLGVCIPTCYPERVFENIFSDETLSEFEKISDLVVMLINLQRFTDEQCCKVIEKLDEYNLRYKIEKNDYKCQAPFIPFNKIRDDCAQLMNCQFYMTLDDDMNLFNGAADEIMMGLHYMLKYPQCGIISYRSKPPRVPVYVQSTEKHVISVMPWGARYNTANGLLCRNINEVTRQGRLFPTDTRELFGGAEEKILAGYRIANGYFGACIQKVSSRNARCKHSLPMRWDNRELLEKNNDGYIKQHWNPDFGCFHCYNLVSEELYRAKGGLDVYSESDRYTIDYSTLTKKKIKEDIKNCLLLS